LEKHGLKHSFHKLQIHYINNQVHLDLYFKDSKVGDSSDIVKSDILSYGWVQEVEIFIKV